jgi:trk system potassium uptake protein TrkA
MVSSGFMDMLSLSKDVSIVEIDVKDDWLGKNLIELNFRKKYGFNIIAIRRGEHVEASFDPSAPLTKEMTLVVIANPAKLRKMK